MEVFFWGVLEVGLEGRCRHAALCIGEYQERVEPEHQRRVALVEDSACCGRNLEAALGTLELAPFLLAIIHQRVRAAARTGALVHSIEHKLYTCFICGELLAEAGNTVLIVFHMP